MEIGKNLKAARQEAGLTQEQTAEHLYVSRQTTSNWENEKTYPDITSVVRLSVLYSISLDGLLKGDVKMLEHLEENTDPVKSNQKLILAAVDVEIFLCCLIAALFLPESVPFIVCVFCLAAAGMTYLMYQVIKKIPPY